MAFIPVHHVLQVDVVYLWDDQKVENTLYFLGEPPILASDMTSFAGLIYNWWTTHMKPLQANTVQLVEIGVRLLTTAISPAITYVPISPSFGTAGGASLPNNASLCVSFRTDLRGRSYRGRNYFIGLTEAQVTNNEVGTSVADDIQDAYAALLTVAFDAGYSWVVVSRYSMNAPRVTGVATPITAVVIVDNTVDSQRRRLPGRGR